MSRAKRPREAVYVLDLVDRILGCPGQREHRFEWLLGDPGQSGRRARLPVDSYWPGLALVVEIYERQHDAPVPHFDKPDRPTVSGVHRGEQRRIYDERRVSLVPEQGLTLLIVRTSELAVDRRGRLLRLQDHDTQSLSRLLDGALARRKSAPES